MPRRQGDVKNNPKRLASFPAFLYDGQMSKKLIKSTVLVSSMTLISRIMGFVRDIIFANVFGASLGFDAFVVAFKIPNFFRRVFGEGAFSQAFVPVLAEFREKTSHEETQDFINRIAGTLGLALMGLVVLGEILAPVIIIVFAPGFLHHPERFDLSEKLLHYTFPYLLFISLTAFSGAILNTFSRFAIPAVTPVLLNVCLIIAALWLAPYFQEPIMALSVGVFLGGVVQLVVQLPFLKEIDLFPRPKLGFNHPGVRKVLRLMLPALFGVSVAQIGIVVDNFFASFLRVGSISWLYYSDRLTYLPLGVFGVALATVVLPYLSRQSVRQSEKEYSETLDWGIRCALLIGMPAAVGLFILARPILSTLIQHGKFTPFDVEMSARSLMAFSVGLPAFILIKVLVSGFYSRQNIRTPVKIAALALVINVVLNAILIKPLAHAGLALATSVASTVNALLLIILLVRRNIFRPNGGWKKFGARIVLANGIMLGLMGWMRGDVAHWTNWGLWTRVSHLIILISLGLLVYFGMLFFSGMRWRDIQPPIVD